MPPAVALLNYVNRRNIFPDFLYMHEYCSEATVAAIGGGEDRGGRGGHATHNFARLKGLSYEIDFENVDEN